MTTINAHFDGKAIVPDEPVDLVAEQRLRITIEVMERDATSGDGLVIPRTVTVEEVLSTPAPDTRGTKDWHSFVGLGLKGPRNPNPLPITHDDLCGDF